jgi:ribosomal protein S18 acetylase RimI-like enzyme
MSARLRVRPLSLEDAPAVAELATAFADYLRGLGDTGEHLLTAEAIRRDGFGPRAAFAGLVAAGANAPDDADRVGDAGAAVNAEAAGDAKAASGPDPLVGYLLYHLGYDADLAARNLHVIDLYVSPAARRQGAGRALMAEAARLCREAGGAYLFWAVYIPNLLAADFYTALGARYVQDLDFMVLAT